MVTVHDLKQFNLFVGLDEAELAQIARLCASRTYDSGAEIFSPGSPAGDIFMLEGRNDVVQIEIAICEHAPRTVLHTCKRGRSSAGRPWCRRISGQPQPGAWRKPASSA